MSEIKHTPGPWIWGADYRGLYGAGPDNEVLDHAHYEGMWLAHHDNRVANANLISAAPELLEALQIIIGDIEQSPRHFSISQKVAIARAAISKATGAA
jgi:hypothetical protein